MKSNRKEFPYEKSMDLLFIDGLRPLACRLRRHSGLLRRGVPRRNRPPALLRLPRRPAASSEAAEPSAGRGIFRRARDAGGEKAAPSSPIFSWSGNTQQMAQVIAEQTGGDLFEIAPATPYTEDYDELLDIAQQEQAEEARPALADEVENWETATTRCLSGTRTGGAMRRWRFTRSWSPTTGPARRWFPLTPAPAAALAEA